MSESMTVRIRLFAGFREVVGASALARAIRPGSTVRQLWDDLAVDHPGLAQWPPSAAVNGDWSSPDVVLAAGDEVAFLPPIAGG